MAKRTKSIHCPECGGVAVLETRADTVEYKGHKATGKSQGYWCNQCGEAIFEGKALQQRERAFAALRARVDGVLGPDEVAAIRTRLELSQRQAGELLSGDPRTFQKYESGSQQVSVPMANLLRLLAKDPRRLADLTRRTTRGAATRSKVSGSPSAPQPSSSRPSPPGS